MYSYIQVFSNKANGAKKQRELADGGVVSNSKDYDGCLKDKRNAGENIIN